METIRVLQAVTHMNRGGLETMLMNYYRNVDRDRVQFDFLTHRSEKKDYDDEILALGSRIFHLPALNPVSPVYLRALNSFFASHPEYRIVHSHLDCMSGVVLKSAMKHGVPVRIAHSHTTFVNSGIGKSIKLAYKKSIPRYATQLFACSEQAGRFMFGNERFYIFKNALDTSRFAFSPADRERIRTQYDLRDDTVIGHVGSFSEPKNHPFIIDVFAQYLKLDPSAHLLLVGNGEAGQSIAEKVNRLGIADRVILTGVRNDIPALLSAFDVFLFPSLFEGFPVSLIEAQTSGLKCFASDAITSEAVLTDTVTMLPLSMSKAEWAKLIKASLPYERRSHASEIAACGYDIKQAASELEEGYIRLWEGTERVENE